MTTLTLPTQPPDDPALDRDRAPAPLVLETDPDELSLLARDAAAMRGSGATGLLVPSSEGQLARWLRDNPLVALLPQGALTSLTGGATPDGDVVVSLRRMRALTVSGEKLRASAGAGLILADLQSALADEGLYYPPAPTHDGATIGGNVSTNAAGAATFKYGTTRDWIERIRVVLRHGDVLELRRGEHRLGLGDVLRIEGSRTIELALPSYRSPSLKKVSAGYFVTEPWDPIDLFIGSEGTLGIITEVGLRLVRRPAVIAGLVFVDSVDRALGIVGALRDLSLRTRAHGGAGLDVRSIEYFDARCLELLRQEDKLSSLGVDVAPDAKGCLLFEQEVDADMTTDAIVDRLSLAQETGGGDDAIGALMRVLVEHEVVERTELAMPSDTRRKQQLSAVREAIPLSISDWLVRQQRERPEVHKVGGDMIVPFDSFAVMSSKYYEAFEAEGVDVAVFGHISDGNVHPNALPRDASEMAGAKRALMSLAAAAKALGGCPLSEHGVGKHPLKKAMLKGYWGDDVLNQMREIKRAFDPNCTLGRGVFWDA